MKLAQLVLSGILTYLMSQIILKLSLAAFFLRIVQTKLQRYIIIGSITVYTIYSIAFFLMAMFQYGIPTKANVFAGKNIKGISAHVLLPMNYVQSSLNVAIDLIFTLTPMFVVSRAMLPMRTKLSVCFLIGLGALGSIASIARIPLVPDIFGSKSPRDLLANIMGIGMVSFAETALGIIAISLATVRPLFARCMESTRRSKSSKTPPTFMNSNPLKATGITMKREFYLTSDPENLWRGDADAGSEDAIVLEEVKHPNVTVEPLSRRLDSGADVESGEASTREDI